MKRWVGRLVRKERPTRRPRETRRIGDKLVYAIGDVHGCYDELRRLEDAIFADAARYEAPKLLVMLGDYVDRGPNSAGVIEHLVRPLPAGFERLCLCGNHDDSMLRFIEAPGRHRDWLALGGEATLYGYQLDIRRLMRDATAVELASILRDAIPEAHVAFLRALPSVLDAGDVVFVHAGLRPGLPFAAQRDEDLLWIREPFLRDGPGLPLTVVHGHTPSLAPDIGRGRVGIDTACYRTGRLTAIRILAGSIAFLSTR